MMTDPTFYITMATAGLVGIAILSGTALTGWRGSPMPGRRCPMPARASKSPI